MICQGEINDTRVLLDEQNEKNELLERKFRKVDAELMEVSFESFENDKKKDGEGSGDDGRILEKSRKFRKVDADLMEVSRHCQNDEKVEKE